MKKVIKRTVGVLLIVAVIFSGFTVCAAPSPYAGEVQSFSLITENKMLSTVAEGKTYSDSALCATVSQLLKTAQRSKEKQLDLTKEGSITLQSSNQASATTYPLYSHGGQVYLSYQDRLYQLNKEDWSAFTDAMGLSIYRYAWLPTFAFTENGKEVRLGITESDYTYRRLDGVDYRIVPSSARKSVPTISSTALNTLTLTTPHTPSSATAVVTKGGKEVWKGDWEKLSEFTPSTSGDYTLSVTASFSSPLYQGTVESRGILSHKPAPTFTVKGSSTFPGEVLVLEANGIPVGQNITVQSPFDFTPNFFDNGKGGQVALFPVHYRNESGKYNLTLSANGKSDTFVISVQDKTFQVQHLIADEQNAQETLLSQAANEEFEKYIAPIRPIAHNTAYWQGTDFIWPVGENARVTTQFGMKRYVNGAITSYRHGAIDFAVPLGTPTKATNNGEVLYAGFLQLTGNTVVIEHGYGLKSWYYHLNSLDVATGDSVVAGQKIGEVGSTGFSTGPHLHFGFSINNVFVNPTTIIDDKLLELT